MSSKGVLVTAGLFMATGVLGTIALTRSDIKQQKEEAKTAFMAASDPDKLKSLKRGLLTVICTDSVTGKNFKPFQHELTPEFLAPENLQANRCAVFTEVKGFSKFLTQISP